MIQVYGFSPSLGLPDLSPFVVKVLAYLSMADIPYKLLAGDARKAPKGKLPYIEDGGRAIPDSSFIVEYLRKNYRDLDAGISPADRALATAVQSMLEAMDVPTRVQSAIKMDNVAEPFVRRKAMRHLELGRVVIFAAGTGNPYFSTDTAAALRAMEIHAEVLLKATKVDGVYDMDPHKHAGAVRYSRLTYLDVLARGLNVMDSTAISLCKENNLPILVFNMLERNNIRRVVCGEEIGTLVCPDGESVLAGPG